VRDLNLDTTEINQVVVHLMLDDDGSAGPGFLFFAGLMGCHTASFCLVLCCERFYCQQYSPSARPLNERKYCPWVC
jgi:hypothetical protein